MIDVPTAETYTVVAPAKGGMLRLSGKVRAAN
jgi:hypothetical protein